MASNAAVRSHQWQSKYPELGTGPLSVDPILSQDVYEKQRDHVFKKVWLFVGRVDQVPKKGDYFVAKIEIAKAAIIIVRQPNGEIGAFHNVCMHRGNKLVWNESGKCGKYLACNFHGWVFDTYGNVANIPDVEDFYDLDKSKLSLRKVRVDVWEGFIFINLDSEGTQNLQDYLGSVPERVKGYDFNTKPTHTLWRSQVKSNWRIIADAQVETYHVPYLHANSVQGAFSGDAHCHALHFEAIGPHQLLSVPFNPAFVPQGVEALAFQFGAAMIEAKAAGTYELPPGMNPSRAKNWQFDLLHIFPNFNILMFRDSFAIHHFSPTSLDQSTWDVHLYQAEPQNAAEVFAQEQIRCVFREAVTEDGGTHEHTQEAIASGAIREMQVKDDEIAVRHGYVMLEKMIADAEAAA